MTKQGITITTWSGGEEPCKRLLKSIWGIEYPVLIVVNDSHNMSKNWWEVLYALSGEMEWHVHPQQFDGFEIGAIQATLEHTDWDEFILLQDTIEIKDQAIFTRLFTEYPGQSVAYNPHFQMYLGKYRRDILQQMALPEVRTKVEAVRQEEIFAKAYQDTDRNTQIFNPSFRDEAFYTSWEEMFGRKNLRMEDEYIIKRKGTWSASQLA